MIRKRKYEKYCRADRSQQKFSKQIYLMPPMKWKLVMMNRALICQSINDAIRPQPTTHSPGARDSMAFINLPLIYIECRSPAPDYSGVRPAERDGNRSIDQSGGIPQMLKRYLLAFALAVTF